MSAITMSDSDLVGIVDELYEIRSQLRLSWLALSNDDWREEEDTSRVLCVIEAAQTRLKAIGTKLNERIVEVALADVGLSAGTA